MPDLRAHASRVRDKPRAVRAKSQWPDPRHERVAVGMGRCVDGAAREADIERANRLFGFAGVGHFFACEASRVPRLVLDRYRQLSEPQRQAVAAMLDVSAERRRAREQELFGHAGGPPASEGEVPFAPRPRPWKERALSLRHEFNLLRDAMQDLEARNAHVEESRKKLKREVGRLTRRLKGSTDAGAVIKTVRSGIRKLLLKAHPDKTDTVSAHAMTIALTELLAVCAALP